MTQAKSQVSVYPVLRGLTAGHGAMAMHLQTGFLQELSTQVTSTQFQSALHATGMTRQARYNSPCPDSGLFVSAGPESICISVSLFPSQLHF